MLPISPGRCLSQTRQGFASGGHRILASGPKPFQSSLYRPDRACLPARDRMEDATASPSEGASTPGLPTGKSGTCQQTGKLGRLGNCWIQMHPGPPGDVQADRRFVDRLTPPGSGERCPSLDGNHSNLSVKQLGKCQFARHCQPVGGRVPPPRLSPGIEPQKTRSTSRAPLVSPPDTCGATEQLVQPERKESFPK